jgi:flagellar protein FlbD
VENLVIELTRLNNQPLAVNSDLIKFVENAHDTVVTLVNGEKLVVCEPVEIVIEKIIAFRRAVLAGLSSAGLSYMVANPGSSSAPSGLHGAPVEDMRAKGQSHG